MDRISRGTKIRGVNFSWSGFFAMRNFRGRNFRGVNFSWSGFLVVRIFRGDKNSWSGNFVKVKNSWLEKFVARKIRGRKICLLGS